MNEDQYTDMSGTMGKFTRADQNGIYALNSEGEERLVGHWQRPRGSSLGEIESLTKDGDKFIIKMSGIGHKLYLLA